MFTSSALKSKRALNDRKSALRQTFLGPGGTLIDPRLTAVPLIQNGKSTESSSNTDAVDAVVIEQQEKQPVFRRVYNPVSRNKTPGRVNLYQTNNSGQLRSTVTGTIYGRIYRGDNEVTITLRKDGGGDITVRGALPICDTGLRFTMDVVQTWESGKVVYLFQCLSGPNPVVAMPVGGIEFRNILQTRLRLPLEHSTAVALIVAEKFITDRNAKTDREKLSSASIPIDHIYDNYKSEIWYQSLSDVWGRLKYKFYPELLLFWEYEELKRVEIDQLETLYKTLVSHPVDFFLTDYRTSRLPPIPERKLPYLQQIPGVVYSEELCALVKFFNAVSAEIMETKCLALTKSQLDKIAEASVEQRFRVEVLKMALSVKYRLLKPVNEPSLEDDRNRRGNSTVRFYRTRDHNHLRLMKLYLDRILGKPHDSIQPLDNVPSGGLTEEQQTAVDNLVYKTNIVLVSGDGGTGKTLSSRMVYELYGARRCLAVAAYTGLATRNQRAMSGKNDARGMTIALVLEIITHGTKAGQKLVQQTEVLIVDEIGVVSMEDFSSLLQKLPNLKKIFLTGDVKQCRPVTAGRVLEGFLGSWSGTDNIVYLTKNQRVDNESRMLIENYSAFLSGKLQEIRFTNDLLDDQFPFKIIKRQNYPEKRAGRVALMVRELRPLYLWLTSKEQDAAQIRIITHTHADVNDLNSAWLTLRQGGRPYDSSQKVFQAGDLVRFTKPFVQQFKSRKKIIPEHLKCDIICTNNVSQIEEIYDISASASSSTAYRNRTILSSTSAPFVNSDMVRILKFKDGTKLNLRDYSLNNIVPGHATTILSSIGHECNYVVVWVPQWQQHFYRDLFYTAITRAKKGVIVVMKISDDYDIMKSDMYNIWQNIPQPTENVIAAYVPKISSNGAADLEESRQISDQFNDYFFDPMSRVERLLLEETAQDLEILCPALGEAELERETERILKHVKEVARCKPPSRQSSAIELENEDRNSRESQWSNGQDFQQSQQEYQRHCGTSNDGTIEISSGRQSPELIPSPKQPKRHFAAVNEWKQKNSRFADSSSDFSAEVPSKNRLSRSATVDLFTMENTRTQLDEELELLGALEEEENPFTTLDDARNAKRQKISRIMDD